MSGPGLTLVLALVFYLLCFASSERALSKFVVFDLADRRMSMELTQALIKRFQEEVRYGQLILVHPLDQR